MNTLFKGQRGAAIVDVQNRLSLLGFMMPEEVDGIFGDKTVAALQKFCDEYGCDLPEDGSIDHAVWVTLVDATFRMGDRTLYLRMPYFHGRDVYELQQALGALGFFCGMEDGIFGAHTEDALRKFQMNLGLPSDGICGAYTFTAIRNLEHSWSGKGTHYKHGPLGFARASNVLERNAICLFGTDEFTRSVASRMSNLAYATNPASKIVSAEMLSVEPDENTLLVQIATEMADDATPTVIYSDDQSLVGRLSGAIDMARATKPNRVRVVFPETTWMEAGFERSAQHFAITLLDALCQVL